MNQKNNLTPEQKKQEQKVLNRIAAIVVIISVAAILAVTFLLSGARRGTDPVALRTEEEETLTPLPQHAEEIFEDEETIIESDRLNLYRAIRQAEIEDREHLIAMKKEAAHARRMNGTFRLSLKDAADFARLNVEIEGSQVVVSAETSGIPISDDEYYYLFELKLYEDLIAEDAEPIAKTEKEEVFSLAAALNNREANSRLFSKFIVTILHKGMYLPVSTATYISNPEALAGLNYSGRAHNSVKGILVDPHRTGELTDLGVNYATYNIPLSRILGNTTNGAHPTIGYSYGGRTYAFNGQAIHEYDYIFKILTDKGIDIAAILLNDHSGAYPQITHPLARGASTAPYRMMNAEDDEGIQALAAVGNFLANRYSGTGNGNVEFRIIGNEVNARKEWNYMQQVDIGTYTAAYTRVMRVFYNAIKAANAGAKVYTSFDQQWDRNMSGNPDYDARDMLDIMANSSNKYGNFDWGIAYHPYSVPVGQANFWGSHRLVSHSASTSMITMGNIEVLTNYVQQDYMTYQGRARSIILSELGYTSTTGEDLQAAAIIYAFHKAQTNGYIDAVMFNRQTDAGAELAQGLALGLNHAGGGHKKSYNAFKFMDTDQAAEYRKYASGVIGVNF